MQNQQLCAEAAIGNSGQYRRYLQQNATSILQKKQEAAGLGSLGSSSTRQRVNWTTHTPKLYTSIHDTSESNRPEVHAFVLAQQQQYQLESDRRATEKASLWTADQILQWTRRDKR